MAVNTIKPDWPASAAGAIITESLAEFQARVQAEIDVRRPHASETPPFARVLTKFTACVCAGGACDSTGSSSSLDVEAAARAARAAQLAGQWRQFDFRLKARALPSKSQG